jgi:glycosyltransferase involved in cell wall biosynthesis
MNMNKENKKKIVALTSVKNESIQLELFLRSISMFSDAICLYDDHSEDDTVEIARALAIECNIERIIENKAKTWYLNENRYRQALLDAGREIGGTHFITLDADEVFTSNLCINDELKKKILSLNPGDTLQLVWIQLWRSIKHYRYDNSIWTNNYKTFVFADDGVCNYHKQDLHLLRNPLNLKGKTYRLDGYDFGVMHFQFVNWKNLLIKQAWYRCLEHIQYPKKPVKNINQLYAPSKDEEGLMLRNSPDEWFVGYPFFDPSIYEKQERWRENDVIKWFEEYGTSYFEDLDIWDIDWRGEYEYQKKAIKKRKDRTENNTIQHKDLINIPLRSCCIYNQPSQYLISAIVSTYNAERFIQGCIENLVSQTVVDQLEIIIINSGSKQNEEAIVRQFQQRYPNIVYLETKRRETVYSAWNRAINVAKGKYMTNANTDDRHANYALEYMAKRLDDHPEIALVYADVWITEVENETYDRFKPSGKYQWKEFDSYTLFNECYIGPQPMWRKKLHNIYGLFDKNFESVGDWEFWLRIANKEKFLHIPKLLGLYLNSPTSIEHRDTDIVKREIALIRNRYMHSYSLHAGNVE